MRESVVPAMKTRPPAVAIDPPRLIEPAGTSLWGPPKSFIEPMGICHRIVPLAIVHGGQQCPMAEGCTADRKATG